MGGTKSFHSILRDKMAKKSQFSEEKSSFSALKNPQTILSMEELLLGKTQFFPLNSRVFRRKTWFDQYKEEYNKYVSPETLSTAHTTQAPQIAREKRNWSEKQLNAITNLLNLGAIGLNDFSTDNEIKSEYRRLAKQYHPDMLQGKSEKIIQESSMRFMQIHRCYKILIGAFGT